MIKNTFPVNIGAMPSRILTINHLIVEETGEVNVTVLKGLAPTRTLA